jgi:Lon protease-like protein
MLPHAIPIFPLPNVVLFPNVLLPLHVFEPRYRSMIGDALDGDRTIGVILLQPGYEAEYERRPPVFSIGCAGMITHTERLGDGRYNIVLRGLERFRLLGEEDPSRPYRVAQVSGLPEIVPEDHRAELRRHRLRIEALLAAAVERTGAQPRFPPAVPDEDLVNALAQHLELDPLERQTLLERDGVLARCRGLIELLEMKSLTPRGSWRGSVH